MSSLPNRRFVLVAPVAPILVGPTVFTVVGLTSGMGFGGTLTALMEQAIGRRNNPLLSGLLGLFPVLILLVGVLVARRWDPDDRWLRAAGWGGLAAILVVLVWTHAQFWPLFLPARIYPGFPHGLEFVIAPLFFAPIAMGIGGLVMGAFAARGPRGDMPERTEPGR